MNRSYLLLSVALICLAVTNPLFAQQNFIEGTVTTTEGETLSGYIDYRNWEVNPETITFKEKLDGKKIIYTPLDLESFKVAKDYYVGRIALVNKAPDVVNINDVQSATSLVKDTLFLSVLIKGQATLLEKVDRDKRIHYLADFKGEQSLELINQRYKREINYKPVIQTYKQYQDQLLKLMSSCKSLEIDFDKLDYRRSDLKELFIAYNNCINSEVTFEKKRAKIRIETRLIAGTSFTNLAVSKPADFKALNQQVQEFNMTGFVNPEFGFSFDIIFPRNLGRWSLNNEFTLKFYSLNLTTQSSNEIFRAMRERSVSATYFKISPMIRYNLFYDEFLPFVNFGISYALQLKLDQEEFRSGENLVTGIIRTSDENIIPSDLTKPNNFGALLGIGTKYKDLSLELRYEIYDGFDVNGSVYGTTISNISLIFGYKL